MCLNMCGVLDGEGASLCLYMATVWGANKILQAPLFWPSDQSHDLTVTTPLPKDSLVGPAPIIDS